jgi:hypothetical protein
MVNVSLGSMPESEDESLPPFEQALDLIKRGTGPNTRAIAVAILWAGERISQAIANNNEAHGVRVMAEDLGRAFIESVRPPPMGAVPGVEFVDDEDDDDGTR